MPRQSNTSQGRGHDRPPNWNPKNGGMLISQPVTSCLTNHSEPCMSRVLSNQSLRISIYRLQRRPSFGFESSVSSMLLTNDDPVVGTVVRPVKCVSDVKCVEKLHQDERTLGTSTRRWLEGRVSDGRLTRLTAKRRVIRTISSPTVVASRRKTTVEIPTQIGGMKQSGATQRIQVCSGNLVTSQSVVRLPLSCVFVICWTVWIVVKVQQAWFIDV